ncbi:MAG: hypothetical protein GY868_19955, partial [Deltaproteobacteria bacterium]|nr:hypothetical protein [Deltaproteobacteria bacterium]
SANFEQALAEVLRQYKIRVVDPGQVSALYDQGNAGTLKAYSGDIQAAIKTGIANRADIVIIGGVQTSSGAVYSMQSGQADIALKAVLCAKSRTLASGNLHAAALQVTAESAKIAAIRKAAQQVVPKNGGRSTFLTDMLAAWKKTK